VAAGDVPNGGETAGDWVKYADHLAGQLDVANDRYVSGVGIIKRCEARDKAAVVKSARHGLFGR
jgi:hypothetical protein